MAAITLTLGGRSVTNAETLIAQYLSCQRETGRDYLEYPCANPDVVAPEDLAVTLTMNSRVTGLAFRTLVRHGAEIIDALQAVPPRVPLQSASTSDLDAVTDLIVATTGAGRDEATRRAARLEPLANGIGVSVATKLLHKKRPALIPILDNEAIFRDYLGSAEPPAGSAAKQPVSQALKAIQADLASPGNQAAWEALEERFGNRTRVQLFDMAWWMDNQARWFSSGRRKAKRCLAGGQRTCPLGCAPTKQL